MWGQIQSRLFGGVQKKKEVAKGSEEETINIFSLASGHVGAPAAVEPRPTFLGAEPRRLGWTTLVRVL